MGPSRNIGNINVEMGELYCGDFALDSGQLCRLVNCYADCDGHLVTQRQGDRGE